MRQAISRTGFTLVEVNLAIFVMAVGVLSMCALYGLGFRENRQSEEDVVATASADMILSPLIAALSSPQLTWRDWSRIGESVTSEAMERGGVDGRWPANGWADYVQTQRTGGQTTYRVISNPKGKADGVFGQLSGALSSSGVSVGRPAIPADYQYGLVVTRRGAVVQLAFRMARRTQSLLSQPVFVSEVGFQGGFGRGDVQ